MGGTGLTPGPRTSACHGHDQTNKKKSSHYKEKNLSLCVMMITNGYTYCGDGFTKYTNIKSLYCAPETDVLHVNYISTKKKKKLLCVVL